VAGTLGGPYFDDHFQRRHISYTFHPVWVGCGDTLQ